MNNKNEALLYKIDDLEKHIERRKENIKIFEDAIKKELDEIENEQQMIEILKMHQGN